VATVLLISLVVLVLLAVLKLGDALRDIAFEIRESRLAAQDQMARDELFRGQVWEWLRITREQRTDDIRRKLQPTLDEALTDAGLVGEARTLGDSS